MLTLALPTRNKALDWNTWGKGQRPMAMSCEMVSLLPILHASCPTQLRKSFTEDFLLDSNLAESNLSELKCGSLCIFACSGYVTKVYC